MFDRKFVRKLVLNGTLAAIKVMVEMTITKINEPAAPTTPPQPTD